MDHQRVVSACVAGSKRLAKRGVRIRLIQFLTFDRLVGKEIKAHSLSEACGTILAKLCYRVADEIGANFGERTSNWRLRNATTILEVTEEKYDAVSKTGKEHAPPRLIHKILEEGSWTDDTNLQKMWAGLLVSSCSHDGRDEGNLVFINILSQLTTLQVKVLDYACKKAKIRVTTAGWITTSNFEVDLNTLVAITGVDDFHRLDRELDQMRGLQLITTGFHPEEQNADISPTTLALQMYAKCQGFMGSPLQFYGVEIKDQLPNEAKETSQERR